MGKSISNEAPKGRLLTEVVDSFALQEPDKPFTYVPQSIHPADGWRPVTFEQLCNAINHVAHEIGNREKHPMESTRFPTIAYIGPSDTRYVIMVLACVKAECKALLLSPQNSSKAIASLFDKTNCRSLWYAGSLANRITSLVGGYDTHLRRVPEEQSWLHASASPFPYDRTPEEAQWDPLMVLQASGSTELPKPVVIRHGVALIMDSMLKAPDFNAQRMLWRTWQEDIGRMLLCFPLFHVGGIMTLFALGGYATIPIALPAFGRTLDGQLISECIEHSGVDCVAMPPSLIEEVSKTEKGVRLMTNLYSVIYAGGSLTLATLDRLTERGVRLQGLMGSADTGGIRRARTTKAHKRFVDNVEATVGSTTEALALDFSSRQALTEGLLPIFSEAIGIGSLQAKDNFFAKGTDSLVVETMSRILQISIEASGIDLDPSVAETSTIYTHPSVSKLANYLFSLKVQTVIGQRAKFVQKELTIARAKLGQANMSSSSPKPPPRNTHQTVLVTGTTGSLGSYVLDRLMALPQIKRVIAMNRDEDGGRARQLSTMKERGLGVDFSKVAFFSSDLADPLLGLKQEVFQDLAIDIDRIVHLAWPVSFNMSIESFEPHICGVKNLANLSACASKAAPVVFASSIATAIKWDSSLGLIPEIRLDDLSQADGGYGLSKLLGSLILDDAAERLGVPVANVRIGQIGGPRGLKGMWTKQELIPRLVASSLHLGMLPGELGPYGVTDWIPVEDVAEILLDIAGVTTTIDVKSISGYYNVVNPTPVPWELTVAAMLDYYQDRINKLVPLAEWIAALEASADAGGRANPGIELLDTYKAMLSAGERGGQKRFATARAEETSPAMKQLPPITGELIQHWCGQWQF